MMTTAPNSICWVAKTVLNIVSAQMAAVVADGQSYLAGIKRKILESRIRIDTSLLQAPQGKRFVHLAAREATNSQPNTSQTPQQALKP
jgi:hypothetical protein